ncbi:SH3 domain-containing protein [Flavobacterium sp. LS1R49]|uniref:SH3 domain-containing protein n=1 Tax=Flavobacterium shii TaxID=2987687 RepID=A0A9X2ZA41_9FLAO|nr:SH3 domain-containing protein [Flavobacterium shii]MCV9926934.1 SH3 domain-containing protein [Flavobacterium shii]
MFYFKNKKMKERIFSFLLVLLLVSFNKVQENVNLQQLKKAYVEKNEKKFIESFPGNFEDFKSTFGWNDKLDKPNPFYEDANEYTDYFFKLVSQPKYDIYKEKIINISINGKWEADGVNYFHKKMQAITETDKGFVSLLNGLNESKVNSFWNFYFDKEDLKYSQQLNLILDKSMRDKSMLVFEKIKKERNQSPENISKNKQSKFEVFDKDGYTNLRADKNSSSKVLDKVISGEEIEILESIGDWWHIKTKTGKIGYVHKSRIRIKTDDNSTFFSATEFKKDLQSKGYVITVEKKCDLNQDGKEDQLLVFEPKVIGSNSSNDIIMNSPVCILINKGNDKYLVYKNLNIIYTVVSNCPSDGFQSLVVKDNYFTIEQNTCGGWYLIDEYTTFKFDKNSDEIVLHKFGQSFSDRKNPDKVIPDLLLSTKNFGKILFQNFNSKTILEKKK